MVAGVLLAAGASSRFGRPKLLELWQKEPLLRHAATAFLEAELGPVVVVIPPEAKMREALAGLDVDVRENPEPARGIGHSVALGIGALPVASKAALIGVADQPLVSAALIRRLCSAVTAGGIVVPRYGSHSGNPRVFDREFFPELAALDGEVGGQRVADAHPGAVVEVFFPEPLGWDVDRPEDWERLLSLPPAGRA